MPMTTIPSTDYSELVNDTLRDYPKYPDKKNVDDKSETETNKSNLEKGDKWCHLKKDF